jgi:hypothetical protein
MPTFDHGGALGRPVVRDARNYLLRHALGERAELAGAQFECSAGDVPGGA